MLLTMKMTMKNPKTKQHREPTFQCKVVKLTCCAGEGYMRKEEKTVAHSVLPSDMPRTTKLKSMTHNSPPISYQSEGKVGLLERLKTVSGSVILIGQSTHKETYGGFLLFLSTDGAKKGAADLPSSEPSCSRCVDCQATAVPFSVVCLSIAGGILVTTKNVWKQYHPQKSVFGNAKVLFTQSPFCLAHQSCLQRLAATASRLQQPRSPP